MCLRTGRAVPTAYLDSYADSYATMEASGKGIAKSATVVGWQVALYRNAPDRSDGTVYGAAWNLVRRPQLRTEALPSPLSLLCCPV